MNCRMFDESQYAHNYNAARFGLCYTLLPSLIIPLFQKSVFMSIKRGLILLSKDCIELLGCVPSINKINNSVWKVQPLAHEMGNVQ